MANCLTRPSLSSVLAKRCFGTCPSWRSSRLVQRRFASTNSTSGSNLKTATLNERLRSLSELSAVGACLALALGTSLYAYGIGPPNSSAIALDSDPTNTQSKTGTPVESAGELRLISYDEVQRHSSAQSLWVVIHGKVYDLTEFVSSHPGGSAPLLKHAGQEASRVYDATHAQRFLTTMLKPEQCIGVLDPKTLPTSAIAEETDEEARIRKARAQRLPLNAMISIDDFETEAEKLLTSKAWGYYSSSAEEGSSHHNNLSSWGRYEFRPRTLRKTAGADTSTTFLGIPTSLPLFVCPTASAGLGNPEGEVSITRGAGKTGVVQALSTMATRSAEEVAAAFAPNQTAVYQLYVAPDWNKSAAAIRKVEELGFKAIVLTVDTNVMGKREGDMRAQAILENTDEKSLGVAASMGKFYDDNLDWGVLPWLKSITSLPIVLKGIQSVEDVELAYEHGAKGVILSNHGGRQLAYAPASIDILYELRQRRPDLLDKMDVFVDGGVRRGTDVVKALCLGAKGVGMGRPFLYANSAYGEAGVVRAVDIMRDEIVRTMRLLGAAKLEDLRPEMVVRRS